MRLEQPAQREETGSTTYRPWQFDLPTLAEMRHEDWPEKVRDWEMFWTRHAVWQNYIQYSSRKNAKPRPRHEEWWGLHDVESVTMVRLVPAHDTLLVDLLFVVVFFSG